MEDYDILPPQIRGYYMNHNQEDLRPYRLYFGLTLLQFLTGLGILGLAVNFALKFFF